MSTALSCRLLTLCLLFAQHDGLRLNRDAEPEYTGYDDQNGWASPKSDRIAGGWTAEVIEKFMVKHQLDVENMKAAAESNSCKKVMVGDSITELFVRGSFNSGQPDPDRFLLRDNVQIFALGGDTFRDMGWRLFNGGGIEPIQKCNPEDVFVLLGTNDQKGPGGEIGSIRDMRNLMTQLRHALPSSTRLIFHAVLPRLSEHTPRNSIHAAEDSFYQFKERLNREIEQEVKKMSAAEHRWWQLQGTTLYADCSDALKASDEHYRDATHLATDGLEALGSCLQARYNIGVMSDQPRLNAKSLARIHEKSSTFASVRIAKPLNKTLLLVGDSVDRNAVDHFCEAYKDNGAQLYFAQEPSVRFGQWSSMGQVDERLASTLESSHVSSWKAWMVHVCKIPALELTVASIFNPKGVSPNPPWWHQETLEHLYNMSFCGEADRSCHNSAEFLRPPLQAIPKLYSDPSWQQNIVINSNFWDADREYEFSLDRKWYRTEDYVETKWKRDAGNLIAAVKEVAPSESVVYWHTANLPRENYGLYIGTDHISMSTGQSPAPLTDYHEVDEGIFGSADAVKTINKAAFEVAKDKGINVLDWESLATKPTDYVDGMHPKAELLVAAIEELLLM